MSQLTKLLEDRLEVFKSELSVANQELATAQKKVDLLTRKVEAFTHALNAERGEVEDGNPAETTVAHTQAQSANGDENKSQIVRDLVQSNANVGTTIKDIKAAFDKAGVFYHPNYPYAVWRRLRNNGTLKEVRGKLYPAKTETASE